VRRFQCDAQYIEALGLAVYNFAMLEYNVAYIIERLKPGYMREYISQKKTAGSVANDFAQALERAKGHAAEADLTAIYNLFVGLKVRREKLLHANPGTAADGVQVLRYQADSIAWDLDAVSKAATDFAVAATEANSLLYGALRP
jgi:hypothetical protein